MFNIKNIFYFSITLIYFNISLSLAKNIKDINSFLNLKNTYLNDYEYIQNNNIKLITLNIVEEAHEVPIVIKLPKKLVNTKQIAVLIDKNPIQLASKVFPYKKIKTLGLNIRLEQDSLIRVAVLDENNIWNVNSKNILVSSPGGCSLPSCNPEKEICEIKETGIMKFSKYKRTSGDWRFKVAINHPMDTGLVTNTKTGKIIPEYFINKIIFEDTDKKKIAVAETYGALSANPIILMDFYKDYRLSNVIAYDTKGNVFELNKK